MRIDLSRYGLALLLSLLLCGCGKESGNSLTLREEIVGVYADEVFLSVVSDGPWTLEVAYQGEQKDWIMLSEESGVGTNHSVILYHSENKDFNPRIALVRARFGKEVQTVTFTQNGLSSLKTGGAGTKLPSWPDFPGLKSEILPGWIELPAVYEINGCAWVHHDMEIMSAKYQGRNFSIFYDASNFMPRWVAYPLTPSLAGSGSRSNNWDQWDPKIPKDFQPATQNGGWGVSGYDRGHMVPSADRVATDVSNWQTFYPTNMVVQKGEKLNQRIWGNLESMVRSWSTGCDTLYVVTGAVPSEHFITDRGGNRVNKPAAFYKALLQYRMGKPTSETYTGIAFYLENRDYDQANVDRSMAMSISDLEKIVETNFFVNLPDQYEEYAEKRYNPTFWGI